VTRDQLDQLTGLRFAGNGPYVFAASAISTDNRASTATFTPPTAGTIGSLQRRSFSGPWFTNADFGMQKITRITERQSLILRMDSTNIFNHPAFSNPGDQFATSPSFGQITSQQNGRRVFQFTAQYKF